MKRPTVSILLVLHFISECHGGFIPAAIAAGVAAPGALMLIDSLSQRLRGQEPRDTGSRYKEENRYNEKNVYNERNIYNEGNRHNENSNYNSNNRFNRDDRNRGEDRYNREDRRFRDDRYRENYRDDRYPGDDRNDRYRGDNRDSRFQGDSRDDRFRGDDRYNRDDRYNQAGRPGGEDRYGDRNRFGGTNNNRSPYQTGNSDPGGVFNTYNINNNNHQSTVNNYANALEMPEMAKNVVTNLKYATRDIQPPSIVVPNLKSSRAGQTSVTVNGRPFTQGSNYVIVGSRAIAIQQIEVVVPDSYAFPNDEINIDIIVYDGDLYEHPARQNVRTTFNGDDLGRDTAVVLENQAIPPASIRISVNGEIVEGTVVLNAVTFPSNTEGESPLPQTGQGVFMLNGQPISPYTFQVGDDKNVAPVRTVKVTDTKGKMLSGLIDIEVSRYNRKEPHPVILINGRPAESTEVLKVNGELVTSENLVFHVNGQPSQVVADFSIPMDLMDELSQVAQNSAVIPSRNNDFMSRDPDVLSNGNIPSSPYEDEFPVGDLFSKPTRTASPVGSASPFRSKPARRPLDILKGARRASKALRRNRRGTE